MLGSRQRDMRSVSLYFPHLVLLCGLGGGGRPGTYAPFSIADRHPITHHPFNLHPGDDYTHTLLLVSTSPGSTLTSPWPITLLCPILQKKMAPRHASFLMAYLSTATGGGGGAPPLLLPILEQLAATMGLLRANDGMVLCTNFEVSAMFCTCKPFWQ